MGDPDRMSRALWSDEVRAQGCCSLIEYHDVRGTIDGSYCDFPSITTGPLGTEVVEALSPSHREGTSLRLQDGVLGVSPHHILIGIDIVEGKTKKDIDDHERNDCQWD